MTSASHHLFLIIIRGAGTTALILSSLAVCVGLTMGGKVLPGHGPQCRLLPRHALHPCRLAGQGVGHELAGLSGEVDEKRTGLAD